MDNKTLLFKDEAYAMLGACFEVYKDKGCGFNEAIYQECLEIELEHREVPFQAQLQFPLTYRGRTLQHKFIPDFVCYKEIIMEIKAVSNLVDEHRAQVINYLKATGYPLGLLVNFGHYPKIEHARILNTKNDHNQPSIEEITL
jgi:GxxExxY protein